VLLDEDDQTVVTVVEAALTRPYGVLLAKDFAEKAHKAGCHPRGDRKSRRQPGGGCLLAVGVDLEPIDGEGGIRTLERACAPYSLSRRVPSATRPPLRAPKP
jgi:hypothetical protein